MQIIFFTSFFSIYFLLSFYLIYKFNYYYKIKFLKYFLIFLSSAFLINLLYQTKFLSFIGYTWLLYSFLFLFYYGIYDLISYFFKKIKKYKFLIFKIIILFNILTLIYGYFNADNIIIKEININSSKIKEKSYKIAQISDVHFSSLVGEKKALQIKNIIDTINPDLVLFTGDFVDKGVKDLDKITNILKKINPKFGKFAVTGNHEYYTGIVYSKEFLNEAGFTILENSYTLIDNNINLVGLNDPTSYIFTKEEAVSKVTLLKESYYNNYTILLMHQPKLIKEATAYFDLMLSGHTHGGQFFPFTIFVKLAFPYLRGLYELENNTYLFVSSGTVYWGPPYRFLSNSEITVFNINF